MASAELEVPTERLQESIREILRFVSSGGTCVLIEDGQRVARVVPVTDNSEPAWHRQSAEIEAAQEVRPPRISD